MACLFKKYSYLMTAALFFMVCLILSGCQASSEAIKSSSSADSFSSDSSSSDSSSTGVQPTDASAYAAAGDSDMAAKTAAGAAEPSLQTSFPSSLESNSGLFVYFNQTDDRWAHSLFGPRDPILTHGCGPTVLAMLISSYSSAGLNPVEAANWAAQNGYCIPGEGSAHTIIEGGCKAFGLSAVSIREHTPDAILQALNDGNVVVALMGPGYFSNSGHFVIIIKSLEDQTVRIADPANLEHCTMNWPLPFLISQLKNSSYGGGPLWAVGYEAP